ncbi:MAG: 30S ribosomal protein S4e [Candidatus Verstraetearchaeota archaeon]|nr:30S ribosomal protein S4e [Candidatus Verstraetearchaeota archaeon]
MGRKGPRRHLKRFPAPAFWPISKKAFKFAVKPSPGPHPIDRCIPLLSIVRDVLGYAENGREARKIIKEGTIKIDGRIRKDPKFPVGLMDVVEIPKTDEHYRLLPHPQKGLMVHEISKEEAKVKLCRIENKTTVKGGHVQLNLHDGRNKIIRIANPLKPEEDVYKTMDAVKISIPEQEILGHIKLEEGVLALIIGGKNIGLHGRIIKIERGFGRHRSIVTLESIEKDIIKTSLIYTFPVGREEPEISIPKW